MSPLLLNNLQLELAVSEIRSGDDAVVVVNHMGGGYPSFALVGLHIWFGGTLCYLLVDLLKQSGLLTFQEQDRFDSGRPIQVQFDVGLVMAELVE